MAELNLCVSMRNAICRCASKVLQEGYTADNASLQHDLAKLHKYMDKFMANHEVLVGKALHGELQSHEELLENVEAAYDDACVSITRLLKSDDAGDDAKSFRSINDSSGVELKLDPLQIPSFDGAMHNWLAFKDLFEELVHNQSYPEPYKLAKLRQCVDPKQVPFVGGNVLWRL